MTQQSTLRMLLRQAARLLPKLIPSEPWRRREAVPRPTPGPDRLRLHLFGGNFRDLPSARAFCFAPSGPDLPVPLNRELTGAFVDPAEVEVVFDPIRPRLDEFLSPDDAEDILLRLAGDNTLIIITELAFGGLPYELDDTTSLTYLGDQVVDV